VVPTLGAAGAVRALRAFSDAEDRDERAGEGGDGEIGDGVIGGRDVCDAVFLDIRMPGHSGLEIAQALGRMRRAPAVVFVTADDSQAVAAFDIGAVDYLLKPLRADRLRVALDRVIEAVAGNGPESPEPSEDDVIPAELGGVTTLVRRAEVQWAKAEGDYVRLHTATGSHLVRVPLRTLARRWEPAGFVQIHRSYLVCLALVGELFNEGSEHRVRLRTGQEPVVLPVSRRAFSDLKRRLRGM
jgi:DNA-binding LytR/AlgR family response regulator